MLGFTMLAGTLGRPARFGALALALALCGCVEQAAEVAPDMAAQRPIERREGVSLSEATVAIVSVAGAPSAVASDFSRRLASEAQSRDIVIADAGKAKYLVRGYLSGGADRRRRVGRICLGRVRTGQAPRNAAQRRDRG